MSTENVVYLSGFEENLAKERAVSKIIKKFFADKGEEVIVTSDDDADANYGICSKTLPDAGTMEEEVFLALGMQWEDNNL